MERAHPGRSTSRPVHEIGAAIATKDLSEVEDMRLRHSDDKRRGALIVVCAALARLPELTGVDPCNSQVF
jgi:hypothetical protein